ncbi:hypothetical protein GE061_009825 [Apolygus lucorum]|uniref:Uncharacterized protein n=1 Tax=Apolygus lucorum TaxID=248454 RepID=A0A6A4KF08_APOLU|nr:hypothetical protein GE061_009825 [Apolygus lucorum]
MPRPRKGKRRGEDKRKSRENGSKLEAEDKTGDKSVSITTLFKSEDLQGISTALDVTELDESHLLLGAVALSRFDVVKKLLHQNFDVDFSLDGTTPLILAVKLRLIEMADFLIRKGADLSHGDCEGNNALLLAAQHADWDQESFSDFWNRIKESRVDINHANKVGHTILHCLVKRQWVTAMDNILKHSTSLNVNHVTGKGVTALMMACSRHKESIIKSLLNAKADILLEDQKSCTALCYAIAYFIQKKMILPNHSIEQLITCLEQESSMNAYLDRRLELLVEPPEGSYAVTMTTVIVHIVTFTVRCLDSGMETLLRLDVFMRIRKAVERHTEDVGYVLGLLSIVAEIVRDCHCCCNRALMENVVTAFHESGFPNICLRIIKRLGTSSADSSHLQTAFLPIILTIGHPKTKYWLQKNWNSIQQPYEDIVSCSTPNFYPDEAHSQIVRNLNADFKLLMNRHQREDMIYADDRDISSERAIVSNTGEITVQQLEEGINSQACEIVYFESTEDGGNHGGDKKPEEENVAIGNSGCYKSRSSCSGPSGIANERTEGFWVVGETKVEAVDKSDVSSDFCAGDSKVEKFRADTKNICTLENNVSTDVVECLLWEPADIGSGDTGMNARFEAEIDPLEDYDRTLMELNDRFYNYLSKYEAKWHKEYDEGYPDALGGVDDYLRLMETLPQIEASYWNMVTQRWNTLMAKLEKGLDNKRDDCKSIVAGLKVYLEHLEKEDEIFGRKPANPEDSSGAHSSGKTPDVEDNERTPNLNKPLELRADEWCETDNQTKVFQEAGILETSIPMLSLTSPVVVCKKTSANSVDTGSQCCSEGLDKHKLNAQDESNRRLWSQVNIVCKLCQSEVSTSYCKVTKYTEQLIILNRMRHERLLQGDLDNILVLASVTDRGNYRLSTVEGVFGPAILALDAFTHQPLVVKSILKIETKEGIDVINFCRKVVAPLLEIHSEQIVPYSHCFTNEDNILLATPLCERNLGEYLMLLKSTAAFSEDLAHMMVNQIVRGLHFLHTRKPEIVHGNLKPSNILADSNGNLRLSEFGLNEIRRYTESSNTLQIWCAQEILKQIDSTDGKIKDDDGSQVLLVTTMSDIQSCGMILHYLATGGVHPYGRYPLEIIVNLNESRRPALSTKSLYITDLVAWMLDHEPKQRPTSWQILNHVYVWDRDKQWKFLLTCAGIGTDRKLTLPVDEFHRNLDQRAKDQKVAIGWVGVIQWGELTPVRDPLDYSDTISGLLALLRDTLPSSATWFLKSFPMVVLTLYRLIEGTSWANHPDLAAFNAID